MAMAVAMKEAVKEAVKGVEELEGMKALAAAEMAVAKATGAQAALQRTPALLLREVPSGSACMADPIARVCHQRCLQALQRARRSNLLVGTRMLDAK